MTPFVNVRSDDEKVAGQNLGQAANYADGAAKEASCGRRRTARRWSSPGGKAAAARSTSPARRDGNGCRISSRSSSRISAVTASGATEPVIGGFKTDDGESGNGTKPTYR